MNQCGAHPRLQRNTASLVQIISTFVDYFAATWPALFSQLSGILSTGLFDIADLMSYTCMVERRSFHLELLVVTTPPIVLLILMYLVDRFLTARGRMATPALILTYITLPGVSIKGAMVDSPGAMRRFT